MMKRYANRSGDSGVVAYAIGPGSITVRFRGGRVYEYTDERPGPDFVAAMIVLARGGRGLSSFISEHVRERYARRLR
jgi:hypothetical protein